MPPLGEGVGMRIDDGEVSCRCRYFTEEPNGDGYAVYAAADDGDGDVAMG